MSDDTVLIALKELLEKYRYLEGDIPRAICIYAIPLIALIEQRKRDERLPSN